MAEHCGTKLKSSQAVSNGCRLQCRDKSLFQAGIIGGLKIVVLLNIIRPSNLLLGR